jgi:hypothetical protein
MRRSEPWTGALVGALAKAKQEFTAVTKDREGQVGRGKYKYATLESLISATEQPLARQGLAVMQSGTSDSERWIVTVTTVLAHSSGEWVEVVSQARSEEPQRSASGGLVLSHVQEVGKTETYLKRYAMAAILGVTAEEDSDGARTQGPTNEEDAAEFMRVLGERGVPTDRLDAYLASTNRPSVLASTIPQRQALFADLTGDTDRAKAYRLWLNPQPAADKKPAKKKPESDEDKAARQAKHDPSWDGARARVAVELREIGTTIDEVDAFFAVLKPPRVHLSNMAPDQRAKALGWLRSEAGVHALEDYRADAAERAAIAGEGA